MAFSKAFAFLRVCWFLVFDTPVAIATRLLSRSKYQHYSFGADLLLRALGLALSYNEGHRIFPSAPAPGSEDISGDGFSAKWLGSRDAPLVIFVIHGGGFVMTDAANGIQLYRPLLAPLKALGNEVALMAVDYTLAPKAQFPTPLAECLAAYSWLLDNGYESKQIVFAGDSAGGNLVLSLTALLRDVAHLPLPQAIVATSPWADLSCSAPSYTKYASFDYLSQPVLRYWASLYGYRALGPQSAHNLRLPGGDSAQLSSEQCYALLCPLKLDFAAFPPCLVLTADSELFRDENEALVARMRGSGSGSGGPPPVVETVMSGEGAVHAVAVLEVAGRMHTEAVDAMAQFISDAFRAAGAAPAAAAAAAKEE